MHGLLELTTAPTSRDMILDLSMGAGDCVSVTILRTGSEETQLRQRA